MSVLVVPAWTTQLTVNQRHAGTIRASLADTIQIAIEEVGVTNFQALLDDLGSELIHAVFSGEADNVIDGASTVRRVAMLTDVLDAPVAKLAMSDDVDASQNFIDAWAL